MRTASIALRLALCVGFTVSFAAFSGCKGKSNQPGPAGVVVATSKGSFGQRTDSGPLRELARGDIIFSDDIVTAAIDGELVVRLDHNNADLTLVGGTKVAIRQSAAWRAPKDVQAGLLEVDPSDGNAAAGRSGDREAADDPSTAAEGAGATAADNIRDLAASPDDVVVKPLKLTEPKTKTGREPKRGGEKNTVGGLIGADKNSSSGGGRVTAGAGEPEPSKKIDETNDTDDNRAKTPPPPPPPPPAGPGGGASQQDGYGSADTSSSENDADEKPDASEVKKAPPMIALGQLKVTPASSANSVRDRLLTSLAAFARCSSATNETTVLLHFVIVVDGSVSNLEMTSRNVAAAVSGCLAKATRAIRFEAGEQRTVRVVVDIP